MYLSCLLIDVGTDPDRPRPGRLWLRNPHRVHQRLCMAFPYPQTPQTKKDDPHFLTPYWPCGFEDPEPSYCATQDERFSQRVCFGLRSDRPVHVARSEHSNFLFRLDLLPGNRAMILVQSAREPDWGYAFHNAEYFLAGPPQTKSFDPQFEAGQHLRFRLLANPTRKIGTKSVDGQRRHGRRVPHRDDGRCIEWLVRKGHDHGFELVYDADGKPKVTLVREPLRRGRRDSATITLQGVRFDGVLGIVDAEAFREGVIKGIGSGKAFGFGLLSLAPA